MKNLTMKISTYNVFDFKYIVNHSELLRYFLKQETDVICLQEVYSPELLLVFLEHYPYNHFDSDRGLAILSRIPFKFECVLEFTEDKGAMFVTFDNSVLLVNLHLDHLYESVREHQAKDTINMIQSKYNSMHVVIAGDFNSLNKDEYTSDKWKTMITREAKFTHPESIVYRLFNCRYNDTYIGPKNPVTSVHQRRVDYIFTTFANVETVIDNNIDLSDHYPLHTVIEDFEV